MDSFADVVSSFCPASLGSVMAPAGLFVSGSEKAVPLRIRSVNSKVHCDTGFADTTETFAFISDEDVSVVFKFPLPPRSAVYKLEATIGDRTIVTEVKPKQEAQATFDAAVNQGHTAVIAKQEESTQIFTLELGNLEAMEEGIVHISYLRVLDSVGGAVEWVHTSTWTPPYLGAAGDQQRGAAAAAEQNPRFAGRVAYSLAYDIQLVSSRGIKAVDSQHNVSVRDEGQGPSAIKRVTVSEQVSDPSKDLTIMVELQPLDAGKHAVATANGYGQVTLLRCTRTPAGGAQPTNKTVALATFVPLPLMVSEVASGAPPPLPLELVLIVDCSGSMHGARITQARDAALYFIKDLPAGRGIKFNVVAFGSSHISWAPGCQDFTADNMRSAVEWVQARVHANLGGTEILTTFKAVYAMPTTPGYTRQIIFLTDGGISGGEEQAVFDLVTGGAASVSPSLQTGIQRLKDRVLGGKPARGQEEGAAALTRSTLPSVLCLGIGHGVHRGLLDGLASRTGGVSQYVVDGESIVRKAGFLNKTSLGGPSAVCAPRLVTDGLLDPMPHVLPPRLFPNQPLHLLVGLDQAHPAATIKLEGQRADGSKWELALPLENAPVVEGDAYAVLHAMCYVSGLVDGSSHLHCAPDGTPHAVPPSEVEVQAAVVAAAVSEHLVTRHTAAVGVMLQKDPLNPTAVKKVEVPLAVPHGAIHFQGMDRHRTPQSLFGPSGVLFGGSNALFGSSGIQPNLFGSTNAQPAFAFSPAQPATFGFSSAQPAAVGFGSAQPAAFGFGSAQPAAVPFGSAPPAAAGFGSAQPAAFGFGSAQPATAAFGSAPASAAGFGGAQPATAAFGSAPASAAGFGGAQPATAAFGSAPPAAAGFGSAQPAAVPFGSAPPAAAGFGSAQPAAFGFGSAQPAAVPFGSAPPAAAGFGSAQPAAFGFGSAQPAAFGFGSAQPAAFGFGSAQPATAAFGSAPASAAGFGGAQPATAAFGSAPASAAGFGGAQPATAAFGSAPPAAAGFGSAQPAAFGFGSAQPAAVPFGSAPPAAAGFGSAQPAAFGFGSAQPATAAFGSAPASAAGFGGAQPATAAFGSAPASAAGFGGAQPATAAFGSAPPAAAGFGSAQPAAFGFGSAQPATAAFGSAPASAAGFGGAQPATAAFGSAPPAAAGFGSAQPAAFGFGSAQPAAVGFGSSNAQLAIFGNATGGFSGSVQPAAFAFSPAQSVHFASASGAFGASMPPTPDVDSGFVPFSAAAAPAGAAQAHLFADSDGTCAADTQPDSDVHGQGQSRPSSSKLSPSAVLSLLNLCRGVEGSWSDSAEVYRAVTSQVAGTTGGAEEAEAAARAARPAELSGEQWATVLALAFLRKYCAAKRSVWEGMEAKAMAWLQAGWPAGARALGFTVLMAMKLE